MTMYGCAISTVTDKCRLAGCAMANINNLRRRRKHKCGSVNLSILNGWLCNGLGLPRIVAVTLALWLSQWLCGVAGYQWLPYVSGGVACRRGDSPLGPWLQPAWLCCFWRLYLFRGSAAVILAIIISSGKCGWLPAAKRTEAAQKTAVAAGWLFGVKAVAGSSAKVVIGVAAWLKIERRYR